MNEEIWKDIKGYEGLYQISSTGRVKSLDKYVNCKNNKQRLLKGKILKPLYNKRGYLVVGLTNENGTKKFLVHRLVALHFLPNPNNLPYINHKDENPSNPHYLNLEWCTHQYNMNYGTLQERKVIVRNYGRCGRKKVLQCDIDGNVIREWGSIKEAGENLKIQRCDISKCLKKKIRTAGSFMWKYAS